MAVDLIKQLRDETGVSVMDCKKALEKANNDLELAKKILKEEGLAKADKRADRETKTPILFGYISLDGKTGGVLELRCETDFVAKHEEFINLGNKLVTEVVNQKPADLAEFLTKTIDGESVENTIKGVIAKFGEKMEIGHFNVISTTNGIIANYIHAGGKVGVLVEIGSETNLSLENEALQSFSKDICMQIAAMNPKFITSDDVPSETTEFFKKEFEESMDMSKPEEMRAKILAGRFAKKYEEICLMNQHFIKDDSKTIQTLMDSVNSQNGINLKISKFFRYQN
jgi:elongation factor Ts